MARPMGPTDFLIHALNFAAPALALAPLLALAAHVLMPNKAAGRALLAQAAINSVAGVAVLAAGLWVFGRDGKMATYAALVLAMATVQWLASRGWRR